jgi:acyl carrier protein
MIPDDRIAEVVSRLTGVPRDALNKGIPSVLPMIGSADSLDTMELILELEEEFDEETVNWALRYVEALATPAHLSRRLKRLNSLRPENSDPLWDWDLDGQTRDDPGYDDRREC